jgi:hypothetical protein
MATKKAKIKSHKIEVTVSEMEVMVLPITKAQFQKYKNHGISERTFEKLNEKLELNTETCMTFDNGISLTVDDCLISSINWRKLYKDAQKRAREKSPVEQSGDFNPKSPPKKKLKEKFALICERYNGNSFYELKIREKFDESKLTMDIFTYCPVGDRKYEGICLHYGEHELDYKSGAGGNGDSYFLISTNGVLLPL